MTFQKLSSWSPKSEGLLYSRGKLKRKKEKSFRQNFWKYFYVSLVKNKKQFAPFPLSLFVSLSINYPVIAPANASSFSLDYMFSQNSKTIRSNRRFTNSSLLQNPQNLRTPDLRISILRVLKTKFQNFHALSFSSSSVF